MASKKINKRQWVIAIVLMVLIPAAFFLKQIPLKTAKEPTVTTNLQDLINTHCEKNDDFIYISKLPLNFGKDFVEIFGHELRCAESDPNHRWLNSLMVGSLWVTISDERSANPGRGFLIPDYGKLGRSGMFLRQNGDDTIEFTTYRGPGPGPVGAFVMALTRDIHTKDQSLTISLRDEILDKYYKEYKDFTDSFEVKDSYGNYVLRTGIERDEVEGRIVEKFFQGDLSKKEYPVGNRYNLMYRVLNSITAKGF